MDTYFKVFFYDEKTKVKSLSLFLYLPKTCAQIT